MKTSVILKLFTGSIVSLVFSTASSSASDDNTFFSDLTRFQKVSPSQKLQEVRVAAASDNLLAKRLAFTPDVFLGLGTARSGSHDGANAEQNYSRASATFNLFRSGADWARMRQFEALKKSEELGLRTSALQIESVASSLIFRSLQLRDSLRVQNEVLRLKEESLKILKERYSQGKSPLQDVQKSEVDLSQQRNRTRLSLFAVEENQSAIQRLFVENIQTSRWPFHESLEIGLRPTPPPVRHESKNFGPYKVPNLAIKRHNAPTVPV